MPHAMEFKLVKVYPRAGQHPGKHTLALIAEVSYQADGPVKVTASSVHSQGWQASGTIKVGISAETKRYNDGFVCRLESWHSNTDNGCVPIYELQKYFGMNGLNAVAGLNEAARTCARTFWNSKIVPDAPHSGDDDFTVKTKIRDSVLMEVELAGTEIALPHEDGQPSHTYCYYGNFVVRAHEDGSLHTGWLHTGLTFSVPHPTNDFRYVSINEGASQQVVDYLLPLFIRRWNEVEAQQLFRLNKIRETLRDIASNDRDMQEAYWHCQQAQGKQRAALDALAGLNVTQEELHRVVLLEQER